MTYPTNFPATFPTLMLDFANRKALDPRITFTRASTASFYDEETTVKGDENLLSGSPAFSSFSGSSITVSGNRTAPDGTGSATRLAFALSGTLPYTRSITNNAYTQLTFSVWIKRISGSGNIAISAGGAYVNQTITTSWARYNVTQTVTGGGATIAVGVIGNGVTSADVIEIWGPQLETGATMTGYLRTPAGSMTNYIPRLMTAATNVPRFDHDPITRESLGLLIEEQRVNLATYSDDFNNAAWSKVAVTVSSNSNIAPDGTLTADKILETTITGFHRVSRTITVSTSTAYTLSVYAKAAERKYLRMVASIPQEQACIVDLVNGVVVGTDGVFITGTRVTNVGGGWFRVAMSFTTNGTSAVVQFGTANGSVFSLTGNAFDGLYLWGAQLEAGAFSTSYIPTVAASVTRSADAASMTGSNFSSWYRPDEGTLFADYNYGQLPASFISAVFSISAGNSTNRIALFADGTSSTLIQPGFYVTANSVYQAGIIAGTGAQNSRTVLIGAYAVNNFAASLNGATSVVDTDGTIPVVDRAFIGASPTGTDSQINGTIRKIAYYPQRLTNAQLQGLTT